MEIARVRSSPQHVVGAEGTQALGTPGQVGGTPSPAALLEDAQLCFLTQHSRSSQHLGPEGISTAAWVQTSKLHRLLPEQATVGHVPWPFFSCTVQCVVAGCKDRGGSSLLFLYASCQESVMKSVGLIECLDNGRHHSNLVQSKINSVTTKPK